MKKILLPIIMINPLLVGGVFYYQFSENTSHKSNITFQERVLDSTIVNAEEHKEEEAVSAKSGVISEIDLASLTLNKSPFDIPKSQKESHEKREASYYAELARVEKEQKDKEELETQQNQVSEGPQYGYNEYGEFVKLSENGSATSTPKVETKTETLEESINAKIVTVTNKYKVDKNIITAIVEETSGYDAKLEKTTDGITRHGLMQIRGDKIKETMESLGVIYDATKVKDADMNLEMGTSYIKYLLDKSDNDIDYVLTAFYHGEQYAESIHLTSESYSTEFSESIKKKLFKLNV